jgi:3-isopropylmalate/(R)-2-methylmalate dehydratase large subunit
MAGTLFDKVWDAHAVRQLPNGQTQLYVGLHLVHEVTSPQAFDMLAARGWRVRAPHRTFATMDHIVPTARQSRPFADVLAEGMASALERNCRAHGIPLFDVPGGSQGIVHVIGPELGLTQPGMTIACGDSHTSTHGAFGALAFGIGTSQVRDVLASQCVALSPLNVRRISINGRLAPGVYAKDVILSVIRRLGINGGHGFAYEYAGSTIAAMTMEERMTICNMSIEGGALMGYVNPDATTIAYLRGRRYAPPDSDFEHAAAYWLSLASDTDASYADEVTVAADRLSPTVTWGTHPGQSIGVDDVLPEPAEAPPEERRGIEDALRFMQLRAGSRLEGHKVDVAFIGSCTNGRLSDLRDAAAIVRGRTVAGHVRALVVPGSQDVRRAAEAEGLDDIFRTAGFEWRAAGCSMCLAMNPDKLDGDEVCASSSNRNFKGRQGSPTGRTLLMSPAMVAAAALAGEVVDVRKHLPVEGAR